jgi:hypothetical protein
MPKLNAILVATDQLCCLFDSVSISIAKHNLRRANDESDLDFPSHCAVYVTRISVTSNPLPPKFCWANATELNVYGYWLSV